MRPYIAKHETDIDRKLVEWKAKVWDVVSFYMQNSAQFGQSAFVQFLQYLASQSARFQNNNGSEVDSLAISFHCHSSFTANLTSDRPFHGGVL